jgi:glycosyltransferase involved in cell wall biosynthesis
MTTVTKILHIITDTNIGGAGHQMLNLLDSMGKDFTAEVMLPENSRLAPLLKQRRIKFYEVPHIAEQSFSWAGVRAIRKKLKEIGPDIVHTHASFSGRVAARLYGKCKIVHTLHCAFPVSKRRKSFPAKQFFGTLNNLFSDRIIATSPVAERTLLDMGAAKKKIRVVFNGVPKAKEYTPSQAAILRRKYKVPEDVFVLTYIARLTEIKGHDYVLDTAKELPYNVMILFAGDGDYEQHLATRIQQENLNNVRLLGFVSEVEELLAIMDAQLNMSYVSETTSLSLLQGMSVGKPAIVTKFSGNVYVIEKGVNGMLVPPCDPEALDEAITNLKNDPELYKRLSEGARMRYSQQFTAKKMAEETEKVYRELKA